MPAAVKTTVTELAGSRVRVQVQVPAGEVQGRLERKARELGRELKLPGFRRGKVPPPLVIQRLGRDAVLEQAVRDGLTAWYAEAIGSAGVVPVGDPELQLGELPEEGETLEFSIEIGVVPKARLGRLDELEAPRREPAVSEEEIDREVDGLRDRLARLEPVERAAQEGDFVVVDYAGWWRDADGESGERGRRLPGGEGRDQLLELRPGGLIEGFQEGLLDASAGETRTIEVKFPEDHSDPELAAADALLEVTVKAVQVKELPELDEDFAIDAGFDSLQELREDIRRRLLDAQEADIEAEFRTAVLDAAAAQAQLELTPELVKARAREMWERVLHTLSHRGISREAYLKVAAREEADILAEMESDAERALRREAVLAALVEEEDVSVSDEELLDALTPVAEREQAPAPRLLESLQARGRAEELREELAARKAIELLAARAKPISVGRAQAREALWTPSKERAQEPALATAEGRLWTPADPAPDS